MLKLCSCWLCLGVLSCLLAMPVNATTVYLVRHAEKQHSGNDPALTSCGQARAQALADYFATVPLVAVFSTPYQRTSQTAAAVADSKTLSVTLYDPAQPELLKQQLLAYTQPVLIVGHSNTVPQLVSLLSGIEVAALTEQQYSMLYQLQLGTESSVILRQQRFSCQ